MTAWPKYSAAAGSTLVYLKDFRLRALGPHVEVWTPVGHGASTALADPAGDAHTVVTEQQFGSLVGQSKTSLGRRRKRVFGGPKHRDGKNALLPRRVAAFLTNGYRDAGDRVVVLVDNSARPDPGGLARAGPSSPRPSRVNPLFGSVGGCVSGVAVLGVGPRNHGHGCAPALCSVADQPGVRSASISSASAWNVTTTS